MTDEWPAHDKRVPLSLAVPGWQGRLMPEAVEKVANGVAIEQERLSGSRFLVVLRRSELSYDGLMEWVEIVSGHADLEAATACAKSIGAQRFSQMQSRLDPDSNWKRSQKPAPVWPKEVQLSEGKRLPVFHLGLWDGVGWNAMEVTVAVFPTVPDNPINVSVVDAVAMTPELVRWFEQVA